MESYEGYSHNQPCNSEACEALAYFQCTKHGYFCNGCAFAEHAACGVTPIVPFKVVEEALHDLRLVIDDLEVKTVLLGLDSNKRFFAEFEAFDKKTKAALAKGVLKNNPKILADVMKFKTKLDKHEIFPTIARKELSQRMRWTKFYGQDYELNEEYQAEASALKEKELRLRRAKQSKTNEILNEEERLLGVRLARKSRKQKLEEERKRITNELLGVISTNYGKNHIAENMISNKVAELFDSSAAQRFDIDEFNDSSFTNGLTFLINCARPADIQLLNQVKGSPMVPFKQLHVMQMELLNAEEKKDLCELFESGCSSLKYLTLNNGSDVFDNLDTYID
eukprot:CAMPEP_0168318384 /NCGR_PEP_ID=MMETSP0213-20121227/447_1 /TAXON_ID=151035 /ORGANISM="Euplotes harpa, Strain FSP1.4" /LENGTH=336 /DNA_ID=CAMNT_0008319441 /DNA_START=1 /DNA_END=1011 /DNA_ORIENTATION=-